MDSDYPFGILWPLCCLFFLDLRILITPLVSCGHCVVCSSSIYGFWLPLWYLVAIVLSVRLRFMDSDYPFGILWPLCCLFFLDLRILITPLVSCGHCVVCPSTYVFWLPLWYLVAIVLSVLRLTASDYPFGFLTKGVIRSRKSKDRQLNGHKIPKGSTEAVSRRRDNTMATRYQRGNQET
jgi:hypothetical protein